ncbi:MAG TPA: cohesin domain-containing protein [Bacteroidales bacterium]|nr:cohesin domain-containing protein [Bacteroidales bacterium]HPS74640.1 cohesin domain-containing protein [Bacteroidales bacterium]
MNSKLILLTLVLSVWYFTAGAQTAPVTTVPHVQHPGPTVTVPVTVSNFNDIAAISLTLDYDQSIAIISGVAPNASLPGFTADWTSVPGRLVMAWYSTSGVTLADNSTLATITFSNYYGGTTALTWFDDGTSCEYAKFDNGEFNALPDAPSSTYYKNGSISFQREAPHTIAPIYTANANQTICIPMKVTQFTNIGSISLTMDYDPSVLVFQGFTTSSVPAGWSFDVQATTPGRMIVGGYGDGFSLADSSILFNACFYYNGGTSLLSWYDANGTASEYADGTTLEPLFDTPQPTFYIDGLVTGPLDADFIADNTTPPVNTTVTFTDLTTGDPTGWQWSFDRTTFTYVNGTDQNSQNPQVQFTQGGLYTVTLTATNAYLSNTETKIAYIRVGIHGLWTGNTSSDWYVNSNWDDYLVPDNITDVVIPATRPFWPIYTGDFQVGSQCKTISLIDASSQMTINGNLIVD